MYGWDHIEYIIVLFISNIVALVVLFFCMRFQRIGRILMFLLFGWAGLLNWHTALHTPQDYISYSDFAFLSFYKTFIKGWFSQNILLAVGFIATSQLCIAAAMWFKGWLYKLGAIGGMIFLICIIPLGVGSGFPFPIIAALAFYALYKKQDVDYLWKADRVVQHKKITV
jgi:hypothetical protein